MGYCAALNCRNGTSGAYKKSSVSFYAFPLHNQALLRQWLQNMGRDMETPSKYHCVCSEHFEESSFKADPMKTRKRRRLLKEAVPSKFILALDGTWLVGTPQAGGDAMSNKTRKRIRISEPCGVPEMLPQWPRLQDWQNEFYKQLLKEKFGPLITLGKDCLVPKSHIPEGGAARVKDPQDLEERKISASLSTGHGGAMTQGSSSGASQTQPSHCSDLAEASGSRHNPAPNPVAIRSGNRVLAGQELDEFRRFLLYHQGQLEDAAVPWFICSECGRSFARHVYLLRHQRTHTAQLRRNVAASQRKLPDSWRNPPASQRKLPDSWRNPPASQRKLPDSWRNPPASQIKLPDSWRNPPASQKKLPDSWRNPPASQRNPPDS